MEPILIICGPSGAGKSTYSDLISKKFDFQWIEVDVWPSNEDVITDNGFRKEWDEYYDRGNYSPLNAFLRNVAKRNKKNGLVLSLTSLICPNSNLIDDARKNGLFHIILYGSGSECMNSFLSSKKARDSVLDSAHWIGHNAQSYAEMSRPEFEAIRIPTFLKGVRLSNGELLKEISRRLH